MKEITLFWKTPVANASRQGDCKLIEDKTNGAALYNLPEDLSERRDQKAQFPQRFHTLSQQQQVCAEEMLRKQFSRLPAVS